MFLTLLLALVQLDVDGDGALDQVAIEGGRLRVVAAGRASEVAWAEAPADAGVAVEVAGTHRLLVARGAGAGLVAEWRDGGLRPLWSGALGPQGVDAEWRRELEVDGAGVLLFETRDDVRRCDRTPLRLYPRRWDFGAGRFRPVSLSPPPPEGAARVVAGRAAPPGLGDDTAPSLFRFEAATSTFDDEGGAAGLGVPRELDDGRRDTAWSEAGGGFGRGTTFVARAATARARVVALRLIPGDGSSAPAFRAANRVRRLVARVGPQPVVIELPEDPARERRGHERPLWAVLPSPIATDCVEVTLDDVHGAASGRTAIAELVVLTDLDAGGASLAPLARAVARGDGDAEHTLIGLGRRGAAALIAEARAARDPLELRRLRRALARAGDPAGAAEVAAGLAAADEAELDALADGLRRMGDAAVAPLAAVLSDETQPASARAAAARALGRLPGAGETLRAAAGQGPPAVRRAVIVALGARTDETAALLEAARAGHPDLWRAAALAARGAGAAARQAVVAAAGAGLEAAPYAERYRRLQTLATLGGVERLAAALDAEAEPALRLVAIDALADGPAGWPLVRARLADADPGVRAAAAARLAAAPEAGGEGPLLERLQGDRWPLVRRAAADALAVRCRHRPAADGLVGAARADRDEIVRRAALAGLVRCAEPRAGALLLAVARDARAGTSLRAYAATLAGATGDRALLPALLELFAEARADALASPDPVSGDGAVRIAAAAAHALGELDDGRATRVLADAAGDPLLPVLQASALGALARRCPPDLAAIAARAERGGDALVARAARLAVRRCQRR
jgi:HEAT repeat protein